jgi:hypothetical protein
MNEALSTLSPAALAGLIVAYLMAASRIAGPLAPLWARLPAPWPQIAPAIMALLPQVADLFKDANTWQSFAVSVSSAIALVLPGVLPKPPEPPSEKPVGPWVDIDDEEKTPPSLPGISRIVGCKMIGPTKGILFCLAFLLPSCAGWKPVVRTTNDVARVLCGEFFGQKQGIDFEQAAKKFCETREDLAPWIEALVAAKREAEPKAAARHP